MRLTKLFFIALTVAGSAHAQAPTGTVAGVVIDSAERPVAGARLRFTNRDTALTRSVTTSEKGNYSAPTLSPGTYRVAAEANGFRALEDIVIVQTGTTTIHNFTLEVGEISEHVIVNAAAPALQYQQLSVGSLISRTQIADSPLNGRNFLDPAKLEPGVQASVRASSNRVFVPALGQPGGNSGRGTRVTVDGGSIMAVGNGGSAMGFSPEVVQEFQVTTANFDLTTGLTDGAAINVTTRMGGNDFHGSGFYFFRDHNLSAYPGLNRNSANPDPFFQRRQFGFALSGPIRHDRLFFFGTYERNEQRGVAATTILGTAFAYLNRITASPYFGNQLSLRVDGRLSEAHTAFIRYSHDGVQAYGPVTNQPSAYPSSWSRQPAWADQSILGVTSVFADKLVNDLRFSYFYVSSSQTPLSEQECPGCLGLGGPSITVAQTGLTLGNSLNQRTQGRRYHLTDYLSWQRGAHLVRFGVDWEYNRGGTLAINNEPVSLTLYSPRTSGFPATSSFSTMNDILRLSLQTVAVDIGAARVTQENGSLVRSWPSARLFFQDTWRVNSRLTVNYGLGWSIDRNLNHDLSKPALLAPILGTEGLGPTRKQWKNFSPVLGFAWTPSRDGKTVIRAGSGFYYDFFFQNFLDTERALLGTRGSGRLTISGDRLVNCLEDVPGVPRGSPLNFPNTPTRFTGANLLQCLPLIRAGFTERLTNADPSIQAIQLTKQGTLNPVDVPSWTALHVNVGLQRELARDFVVSADFVYRHFDHLGLGQPDMNHFNRVGEPVIPRCVADEQRNDPYAICSTGAINVQMNAGRATYTGLLVRADKRFSHGFQLLGSWAYSSNTGTSTPGGDGRQPPGFNLDDLLSNRGPLANDTTHILNFAGIVQLPRNFRLSFNFGYASTPPFAVFVGGIDFNGDGTTDDLLPGTTLNAFNRSLGRADLERLVNQFNQTYAGTLDAKKVLILPLTLPKRYSFGDNSQSLDLQLSRQFVFAEKWRLLLIAEAFNVYNAANLSGYSGNVTSLAFGQPTARFTQVFGSGGPRAFQFGVRLSF